MTAGNSIKGAQLNLENIVDREKQVSQGGMRIK